MRNWCGVSPNNASNWRMKWKGDMRISLATSFMDGGVSRICWSRSRAWQRRVKASGVNSMAYFRDSNVVYRAASRVDRNPGRGRCFGSAGRVRMERVTRHINASPSNSPLLAVRSGMESRSATTSEARNLPEPDRFSQALSIALSNKCLSYLSIFRQPRNCCAKSHKMQGENVAKHIRFVSFTPSPRRAICVCTNRISHSSGFSVQPPRTYLLRSIFGALLGGSP